MNIWLVIIGIAAAMLLTFLVVGAIAVNVLKKKRQKTASPPAPAPHRPAAEPATPGSTRAAVQARPDLEPTQLGANIPSTPQNVSTATVTSIPLPPPELAETELEAEMPRMSGSPSTVTAVPNPYANQAPAEPTIMTPMSPMRPPANESSFDPPEATIMTPMSSMKPEAAPAEPMAEATMLGLPLMPPIPASPEHPAPQQASEPEATILGLPMMAPIPATPAPEAPQQQAEAEATILGLPMMAPIPATPSPQHPAPPPMPEPEPTVLGLPMMAPIPAAQTSAPAAPPEQLPPPEPTTLSPSFNPTPDDEPPPSSGTMMIEIPSSLRCIHGALAGKQFPIPDEGFFIGRDGAISEVVVPDERISGRHVWVGRKGPDVIAIDKGSTNGTFLNTIESNRITETVLMPGDELILSRNVVRFRLED